MATYYGSWVATDDFRAVMTITTSETDTSCTFKIVVKCQSNYAYAGSSGYASVTFNGSTTKKQHSIAEGTTTTMMTLTKTVSKTSSKQTISVKGKTWIDVSSPSGYRTGSTASASVTVPALPVTTPGTPTNVKATYSADNNIKVTWTLNKPSSGSISKNTIQIQTDDGSWTTLSSSLSASATSYSYTSGTANHRYRFRVSSTSTAGTSSYGYSGYVYTTPAAPSSGFGVQYDNLKGVTAVVSNINWADDFEWQRSSNNSSWVTIPDQSSSSITDNTTINLPYYRCRALAPNGLAGSYSSSFRVAKAIRAWVNSNTSPDKIFINIPSGSLKGVYFQSS